MPLVVMRSRMDRRQFLAASLGPSLVLLPSASQAFLPGLILRFFLGGAVRTAGGTLARGIAVRSLGIRVGAVATVSIGVAQLVKQYNAQAVFVSNAQNVISIQGNNSFALNLNVLLEDVASRRRESSWGIYASDVVGEFHYTFKVGDLPFLGVKRLIAFAEGSRQFESANFVVADSSEVSYG